MRILTALILTSALHAQIPVGVLGGNNSANLSGYSYSRTIDVDKSKLGTGNLTGFPVLVSISGATSFKVVGSGGNIQNTATQASGPAVTMPTDLIFTSNSAGTAPVPWEVESYDGTNGNLVAWVKLDVNGSAAGSNTRFYVFYGSSSITTPQNIGSFTPANVWDSDFCGVWHIPDGSSLISPSPESTSNGFSGTLTNTPTATTGQIAGAGNFVTASTQSLNVGDHCSTGTGDFTLSSWFNAANATQLGEFTSKGGTPGQYQFGIGQVNSSGTGVATKRVFFFGYTGSGFPSNAQSYRTSTDFADGSWHYAVASRASGAIAIYVDGTSQTLTPDIANNAGFNYASNGILKLGLFNGAADEIRISTALARSANWILSEYNNQKNPGNVGSANFLIFGSEVVN